VKGEISLDVVCPLKKPDMSCISFFEGGGKRCNNFLVFEWRCSGRYTPSNLHGRPEVIGGLILTYDLPRPPTSMLLLLWTSKCKVINMMDILQLVGYPDASEDWLIVKQKQGS
jgi:hypothetical protein